MEPQVVYLTSQLIMDFVVSEVNALPNTVVFLHGYCTPGAPSDRELEHAAIRAGVQVTVISPVAPSGPERVDPFNPTGQPSWFRYSTDLTATVPQRPDDPHATDVHDMLYAQGGLVSLLQDVVAERGSDSVIVVGESQGGVMAGFLALAWAHLHPDSALRAIGLVRTAVHPWTWQDLSQVGPGRSWPTGEGAIPPPMTSRIAIVLGENDAVFRPYASLYAVGPLLETNPAMPPGLIGMPTAASGRVRVRVLPGVDHDGATEQVFTTLFQELTT